MQLFDCFPVPRSMGHVYQDSFSLPFGVFLSIPCFVSKSQFEPLYTHVSMSVGNYHSLITIPFATSICSVLCSHRHGLCLWIDPHTNTKNLAT